MNNLILFTLFFSLFALDKQPYPTVGKIEVLDPEMKNIIDPNAKIELLGEGMTWAEGPVWVSSGNYLLFSDPRQNTIYKWDEMEGLQVFLKPSGYAGESWYSDEPGTNGLLIDQAGELIACDHGNRRLSKISLETKGNQALVDRWEGKRFNSPNDLWQLPNGDYFFTDPPYGLPGRLKDTINREIPVNGVYRLKNDDSIQQVIADLDRPNGITGNAAGDKLYVALSDDTKPYIMEYAVKDGEIMSKGRIFVDFKAQFPNESVRADGIKVDAKGNLFAAAGDGVVLMNASGRPIGRIHTGIRTANCAFGADGYLYMTASDKLLRVKLK